MAYPEPVPELKGSAAKKFLAKLQAFRLTGAQKKFYKGATTYYRKLRPKE